MITTQTKTELEIYFEQFRKNIIGIDQEFAFAWWTPVLLALIFLPVFLWQIGVGVVVGVGDNASGMYHADTKNRIINYNTFPIANHGQHTTGTVLGNGTIFQEGMGLAPNATGISHNFSNVWVLSTNMLPVEEPINILIPHVFLTSMALIWSMLSCVAPR